MAKLYLTPDSDGYGAERGPETLRVQLDGGASRSRKDIIGASYMVNVQWILDAEQYDYLMAFYRTSTDHGALSFDIDLITEDSAVVERTAKFLPGGPQLSSQRGLAYFVSATLEVEAPVSPTEATDDATTIDNYETSIGV